MVPSPLVSTLLAAATALLLSLPACDCNSNSGTPQDLGTDADGGPTDAVTEGGTAQAHGILGRHSAMAASADKLLISAYEAKYGDLVLVSATTGDLTTLTKLVVDGVPTTASPPSPGAYRDGITDAGDDVGQDTDIVVGSDGEPMISYRDLTNRSVKFAIRSNATWTKYAVQQPADAEQVLGRYTALALVDGKPAMAYLALNIDAGDGTFKSELRWAAANKAAPMAAGDWTISTISSATMSCQNLCASDEACVPQTDGTSSCQKTSTDCDPKCVTGEACISGTCTAALEDAQYIDIPTASGLWPTVVTANGAPLVLYYDRVKGNLMGATLSGGTWTTKVVKGDATDNVGAFCTAVVDGANTVHVAYQDATNMTLHYAQVDPATLAAKLTETIDDGVRTAGQHQVGADVALIMDPSGKARVVYQDATETDLLTAVRDGADNWTPKTTTDPFLGRLLKGGAKGYGFYSDLALSGGKVYGSTFFYDQSAKPKGGLELFTVP